MKKEFERDEVMKAMSLIFTEAQMEKFRDSYDRDFSYSLTQLIYEAIAICKTKDKTGYTDSEVASVNKVLLALRDYSEHLQHELSDAAYELERNYLLNQFAVESRYFKFSLITDDLKYNNTGMIPHTTIFLNSWLGEATIRIHVKNSDEGAFPDDIFYFFAHVEKIKIEEYDDDKYATVYTDRGNVEITLF